MNIQETFAKNMRKHRKRARLSQAKLAELAHLHRTYIGGIEQGRINVSLKNIGKIANALKIDPAALFLSDGDEPDIVDASGEHKCSETSITTNSMELDANDMTSNTPDYVLCTWCDGKLITHPIKVSREDLTIQILYNLIQEGYAGDSLVDRYSGIHREILSFLESQT